MAFTELVGSDLVQMMVDRLGGYANAPTADSMLDLLNEGKDKVWTILKQLNESFFHTSTQGTDSTKDNYFGALNTTTREYQLPKDFRAIRFIEVTSNGYASVRFRKVLMTDPEWQSARRAGNDQDFVTSATFEFLYDITESDNGGFQMVLAQVPSYPLQLRLWYIRGLPDFEAGDSINQILRPYSKSIVNFAVKQMMLVLQDESMSESWLQSWTKDILDIAQSAGPVNQADPKFVQDFFG